jgi:hypothetical protein
MLTIISTKSYEGTGNRFLSHDFVGIFLFWIFSSSVKGNQKKVVKLDSG